MLGYVYGTLLFGSLILQGVLIIKMLYVLKQIKLK